MGECEEKLKVLLERKKKADALPKEKLKRWQKQYDEICSEITAIEKKIGRDTWDENAAVEIYVDAVKWISLELNWWSREQFLKSNPNFVKIIIDAGEKVDYAFKIKSMNGVRESIENYKEVCSKVASACDTYEKTGFMPVMDGEKNI